MNMGQSSGSGRWDYTKDEPYDEVTSDDQADTDVLIGIAIKRDTKMYG